MQRLTSIARQFTLEIPSHWIGAIINGDETSFDYYNDPEDFKAYESFCENEIPNDAIFDVNEDSYFSKWHDAKPYGVLPCDVTDVLVTVYDK